MKKLVLRVHTQRVLLEGLYHRTLMGFKWQTRTKVLHDKPSFFVDSYKVAPNKKSLCIYFLRFLSYLLKSNPILFGADINRSNFVGINKEGWFAM